jgi:hypothetical protein
VFCCGLLYHLEKPKEFLNTLSTITKKVLILNTHFSPSIQNDKLPNIVSKALGKIKKKPPLNPILGFNLSRPAYNEGLPGRWYTEYSNDRSFKNRENLKWSSWDNHKSFWIQREYLLQTIYDVGFDLVLEQYDNFAPTIAESMSSGYYKIESRGTFIGIKT